MAPSLSGEGEAESKVSLQPMFQVDLSTPNSGRTLEPDRLPFESQPWATPGGTQG